MWYGQTISNIVEPVSLAEAKAQCRVDHADEDEKIRLLISAVREHAEKYCGQSFAVATLVAKATDWCDLGRLPTRPLTSIAIVYVDAAGADQTFPPASYSLVEQAVVLAPGVVWPARQLGSSITVTLGVGSVCPPAVKQAILLRIDELYDARGSKPDGAWSAFDSLLSNHRY